jgi:uncharacterized protein YegL
MPNKQEVIGILDRSGSMAGKEKDTVGGINTMINELKANANNSDIINVSLKLFDHEETLLWRSKPLSEVTNLETREFIPRGQTALLDALGNTLTYFMEKRLMDPDAYTSCLIYVATDGIENASKYYTRAHIKKLILRAKEKYNIEVIYLAANQDAILEANNIGINANQAINYNETFENTQAVYRAAGRVASSQRSNPSSNLAFLPAERQASQPTERQASPLTNNMFQPPPLTRSSRVGQHYNNVPNVGRSI